MCGIVGFVGKNGDDCTQFLIQGLKILENRGYDSAGLASVSQDSQLLITKRSSRNVSEAVTWLADNCQEHQCSAVGIGHTRWATHGPRTDVNAHPHFDSKRRVAAVHNGVIENYKQIRQFLASAGIQCESDTDTEVIPQLIGFHLDSGLDLLAAVKETLKQLEGTWGLVVISPLLPEAIIAARNGSPLVVGISSNRSFVASEPASFGAWTRDFISLQNGEIAVVRSDTAGLDLSRIESAFGEQIQISPAPYEHWTLKEIHEQPEAASRTILPEARISGDCSVRLGGLDSRQSELLSIDNLIISASGTSLHAAMMAARRMRSLQSFNTIQVMDAAEIDRDCLHGKNVGFLAVSQSGETKDVHRSVVLAQEMVIPTFSVVNAVDSLIARTTKCGVYLHAGREYAVASTKSFVCQSVALDLIAMWFSDKRGTCIDKRRQLLEGLRRVPTDIKSCLQLSDKCRAIAQTLVKKQHLFVLGKGLAEPVAREAALKIKEISYLHAEGYSAGSLKHGPFALIEEGTDVIVIILSGDHKMPRTAAEEVTARSAATLIVTDDPTVSADLCSPDRLLVVPKSSTHSALLAMVPLQLLAYELAVAKGINPDKPRNLAKAVTVD